MENVQRRAVRFIAGLKGIESVSEAREILDLEVLELKKKKPSNGFNAQDFIEGDTFRSYRQF